jgi:hypothetical protein
LVTAQNRCLDLNVRKQVLYLQRLEDLGRFHRLHVVAILQEIKLWIRKVYIT